MKKNNDNLKIYARVASRSGNATMKPATTNGLLYDMRLKSGEIGVEYFKSELTRILNGTDSDGIYAGIYVGGHGTTGDTDSGTRQLLVEGGTIANIIGGLKSTTAYVTNIYMKGGNVYNIVAGAGRTETRGDRRIQITDGKVYYSVSGGSNGFLATTNNSSGDNGRMNGNTMVYVGGDAEVGTAEEGSILYEVTSGSVMGAGNGAEKYSANSGRVFGTHVIIDGNAKINNSVFGGGNYGVVGQDVTVQTKPRVAFTNRYLTILANERYLITSGKTDNSASLVNTYNGLEKGTIAVASYPSPMQEWYLEDSGNGTVYIKNAATGKYLGTNYNRETLLTDEPQTAFNIVNFSFISSTLS